MWVAKSLMFSIIYTYILLYTGIDNFQFYHKLTRTNRSDEN